MFGCPNVIHPLIPPSKSSINSTHLDPKPLSPNSTFPPSSSPPPLLFHSPLPSPPLPHSSSHSLLPFPHSFFPPSSVAHGSLPTTCFPSPPSRHPLPLAWVPFYIKDLCLKSSIIRSHLSASALHFHPMQLPPRLWDMMAPSSLNGMSISGCWTHSILYSSIAQPLVPLGS